MKNIITKKIPLLIAISGLILIIFGFITVSILNDDVNFGSVGNNDNPPDITPTPTQTMDVEENPLTSPTPTPVETETPGDIILPPGDTNNPDTPIGPTTPPDQGPDGSTTGEYVPPAEDDWIDESIPEQQYQLQLTNEVSESEFGRLNDTESLGVNFIFKNHTLYSIVKNGNSSVISYQGFRILGSIGTQNIFMCTWNQPGQFDPSQVRIYKCQIDESIDTNQIAVSIVYY